MTERERMILIISKYFFENENDASVDGLADYLLANGVTILPCKVGDKLYSIWEDDNGVLQIDETEIVDVSIHKIWVNGGGFDVDYLGKSDFLSREEAERAIAERCAE